MIKSLRVRNEIKKKADYIIKRLKKEGIIVQRYDCFTTNSIYLKLDYGVINTIRISVYPGKKHLSSRYNLLVCCSKIYRTRDKYNFVEYYFPLDEEETLIKKILFDRHRKIIKYGLEAYKDFMRINKVREIKQEESFWKKAIVV